MVFIWLLFMTPLQKGEDKTYPNYSSPRIRNFNIIRAS